MANEEFQKLQEYRNEHKEWRDNAVTQLGTTNSILFTLSSGLFVLCFNGKKIDKIHFNLCHCINWQATAFWLSVLLLGASIIFGFGVLLSRLYDFRITRHLAFIREMYYKKWEREDLKYTDFGKFKTCDRIQALFYCIFCEFPLLNADDAENISKNMKLMYDFQHLSRTADVLGTATWRWTKIQIGLFLLSGILYLIYNVLIYI